MRLKGRASRQIHVRHFTENAVDKLGARFSPQLLIDSCKMTMTPTAANARRVPAGGLGRGKRSGTLTMRDSRWPLAQGRLIVSCQASAGDAFHGPGRMALFARAAVDGGAGAIRAHGPADVSSIVTAVDVPVLAIHKELVEDGAVLITPSFARAQALAAAGADAIALDCTARGVRYGALDRLRQVRRELSLPVMADIATLEEAEAAAAAGADFVLSTMRGYTDETRTLAPRFEPDFIAELVRRLPVPVIAEGRIQSPPDARAAMEAGAWAVVVGTAVTRPHDITRGFAQAVASAAKRGWTAAIDVGATNIKAGLVSGDGTVAQPLTVASARGGAELLKQVCAIATDLSNCANDPPDCLAVATAGWVSPATGAILHATGNIEGWTGAPIAHDLSRATRLPVFVENDAICAAAGEWLYGAARGSHNALCITLGTGIGAGAIVEGRLLRGAQGLAQMLGHIPLPGSGRECNCGLRGCVEAEVKLLAGALDGETVLDRFAALLSRGLVPAVHLLDPEVIVLAGGLAAAYPRLAGRVQDELASLVLAWAQRRLRVVLSGAGQHAGVRGAAAMARLRRQDS